MIIATAGHVDHGKTSLIRALTGVDTDRLAEEKRRGLTIELGFAWLPSETGELLGFIDVPGHERFIGTMLAGVAGVDMALLVVAADDGVMPQTREHLAILQLLGVRELALAISRCDLVDDAQRERVVEQVQALAAEAGWSQADVWRVSSTSGQGIDALRQALQQPAEQPEVRPSDSPARFMIDRRFSIAGAGCVVTGTLVSGRLQVGQKLWLHGQEVRVRSLQRASSEVAEVRAGQRCALNLGGAVSSDQPQRADWLSELVLPLSDRLDVSLTQLPDSHWHRGVLQLHLGTAVHPVRVVLLDEAAGLAQLMLEQPVPAVWGDRFIIRDPAANTTLGGGRVLDPQGVGRGRSKPQRLALLAAWSNASTPSEVLAAALQPGAVALPELALKLNLPAEQLEQLLPDAGLIVLAAAGQRVAVTEPFCEARWQHLAERLADWHQQHPELLGPGEGQIGLVGCLQLPLPLARQLLQRWQTEGRLQRTAWALHLPQHRPQLQPGDAELLARVVDELAPCGLRPPIVGELATALEMELAALKAFLLRMQRSGELIAVAPNRYYLPSQVEGLVAVARQLVADSPSGSFNAAQYRDASGIGRNLTIQVLEYLDRAGVTRFVREQRFLVAG
ncbi:selenocysteine-specific elongation factor [Halopseudomonas sabulinigri]|uniref:Selenocysteine-specific elongation factor n=1 Tax=Halopseudomonas sabulinigri TaxID=472181 RepID=A0A1H1XMW3_9GAMM|nr:selenocysteine-specific translation elongation factor [Halopseudomonas sabulinigri]SDT10532.1 selenocysteine-specific elongation factor [Halopseudomonas sabulinigri]